MQKIVMSNSMLMAEEKYQIGNVFRQMPEVLGSIMAMGRQARARSTD